MSHQNKFKNILSGSFLECIIFNKNGSFGITKHYRNTEDNG